MGMGNLARMAQQMQADMARVEQELRDLYSEPFFFKAVRADVSDEMLQALRQAELKRLEEELKRLRESIDKRKEAQPQIVKRRVSELLGVQDEPQF